VRRRLSWPVSFDLLQEKGSNHHVQQSNGLADFEHDRHVAAHFFNQILDSLITFTPLLARQIRSKKVAYS
jgi:hypothetical protein